MKEKTPPPVAPGWGGVQGVMPGRIVIGREEAGAAESGASGGETP